MRYYYAVVHMAMPVLPLDQGVQDSTGDEGQPNERESEQPFIPGHRGSVVPRDPDSVDVSQGLELCSQPWRTAGGGSPRAHPPRTIPKLRAANAGNTCNFEVSCAVLNGAAHIDFLMAFDQIHRRVD